MYIFWYANIKIYVINDYLLYLKYLFCTTSTTPLHSICSWKNISYSKISCITLIYHYSRDVLYFYICSCILLPPIQLDFSLSRSDHTSSNSGCVIFWGKNSFFLPTIKQFLKLKIFLQEAITLIKETRNEQSPEEYIKNLNNFKVHFISPVELNMHKRIFFVDTNKLIALSQKNYWLLFLITKWSFIKSSSWKWLLY